MKAFKRIRTLEMIYASIALTLLGVMLAVVLVHGAMEPISTLLICEIMLTISLDIVYFSLSFKKIEIPMLAFPTFKGLIQVVFGICFIGYTLQNSSVLPLVWFICNGIVTGFGLGIAFASWVRYLDSPERQARINADWEKKNGFND